MVRGPLQLSRASSAMPMQPSRYQRMWMLLLLLLLRALNCGTMWIHGGKGSAALPYFPLGGKGSAALPYLWGKGSAVPPYLPLHPHPCTSPAGSQARPRPRQMAVVEGPPLPRCRTTTSTSGRSRTLHSRRYSHRSSNSGSRLCRRRVPPLPPMQGCISYSHSRHSGRRVPLPPMQSMRVSEPAGPPCPGHQVPPSSPMVMKGGTPCSHSLTGSRT